MPTSLADILVPKHALLHVTAVDRFDVATQAVAQLCKAGAISEELRTIALQAVLERERDLATGLEHGLAVPHGFCVGLSEPVAAVVTLMHPVDFEAMDGQPTVCAVVLVEPSTPEARSRHLGFLAQLAEAWMQPQVRQMVMEATTPDDLISAWSVQ